MQIIKGYISGRVVKFIFTKKSSILRMEDFFWWTYLISFRRAALPVRSRIYFIDLRRTLNWRRTTIFAINGEWIGKIFSIPIPSRVARTVIIFESGVSPLWDITKPRKIWIRSLSPSLIFWWTSTSWPVFITGRSVLRDVPSCPAWIAAISVESIILYLSWRDYMIDVRKSKFFFEIKSESKKGLLPIAKMKFVYTIIIKKNFFR